MGCKPIIDQSLITMLDNDGLRDSIYYWYNFA